VLAARQIAAARVRGSSCVSCYRALQLRGCFSPQLATNHHAAAAPVTRPARVNLLDTAAYPSALQLALYFGNRSSGNGHAQSPGELNLHVGEQVLELTRCRSVWWRRPQQYEIAPEIVDPELRSWSYTEAHEALQGVWRSMQAFWLNDPVREESAAHKPFQLSTAPSCGLEIPRTLITNSPEAARAFIAGNGRRGTIYKAFLATPRDWRETRLLRHEELSLIDKVRFTPVIFQEYIPAEVDLRITVVGDQIYPAAIYSQEQDYYPNDFRMDMERARYEPATLPPAVVEGIRRLMARLGLVYGAIDMRRTPDGRYVFIEINPSGQWRFVEEPESSIAGFIGAAHQFPDAPDRGRVVARRFTAASAVCPEAEHRLHRRWHWRSRQRSAPAPLHPCRGRACPAD